MKRILFVFVLISMIFTGSCVEPLDVNIQKETKILVVEGYISTQPGPHTIAISKSAKYGSIFEGFIEREDGADVSVRDDLGRVTFLIEKGDGVYQTPIDFMAEVGRSYTLLINTRDGKSYISQPELVTPVPEIDELTYEFEQIPSVNESIFPTGLLIYAHFTDPEEEGNRYMWNNRGTYQINARPDLHLDEFGQPDPLECCNTCWRQEIGDMTIRIYKDNLTNGSSNRVPVAFIKDDGIRYADKYLIRVEQASISKEAYNFFELLDEQLSIDGDIFDPPPATVRGNIINLTNPDENVIGFFRASDVKVDSIFLYQEFLDFQQQQSIIRGDCRNISGATIQQPSYWF